MISVNINNSTPVKLLPNSNAGTSIPKKDDTQVSSVYGYLRNAILSQIRTVYTHSRDLQGIVLQAKTNAIGQGIRPNLEPVKDKLKLSEEDIDYINEKFREDMSDIVCSTSTNIYDLQNAIVEELALAGELYIYVFKDNNGKLCLQPVNSEFISPFITKDDYIDVLDKRKKYISYGIESDAETNKPLAFWYLPPNEPDRLKAKRLPVENTFRIANQSSFDRRGTPFFANPTYLQKLWSSKFNIANRIQRSSSITAFLYSHKPETKVSRGITDNPSSRINSMMNNAQMAVQDNPTGVIDPNITYKKKDIVFEYSFNETDNVALLHNSEKMEFPSIDAIGTPTFSSLSSMISGVGVSMGVTYEQLTGDFSKANFSSARVSLENSRNHTKKIYTSPIVDFMMCIWKMWIEVNQSDPIIQKMIADNGMVYQPIWITPKQVDVDHLKTANTNLVKMQMGILTPSQMLREEGIDPETHRQNWIKDNNTYGFATTQQKQEEQDKTDEQQKQDESTEQSESQSASS